MNYVPAIFAVAIALVFGAAIWLTGGNQRMRHLASYFNLKLIDDDDPLDI